VIAVGANKKYFQFGLPGMNELACYPAGSGVPNALRVHEEAKLVALPGSDKLVRLLHIDTGRIVAELRGHADFCTDCVWKSRNQLLSGSKDRTVKLFDVNRGVATNTINTISPVFSLCETASTDIFVGGCLDGSLRMIDVRTKSITTKINNVHPAKQVSCVITAKEKDFMYSLGLDSNISISSVAQGARVRQLAHPELIVKNQFARIAIDPLAGFIAAGSDKGTIVLFDLTHDVEPKVLVQHTAPVCALAYAANLLIAGDQKGTVSLWS
jgi:WD40 repeat protein